MNPWMAIAGAKENMSRGRSATTDAGRRPPTRRPARPPRRAFISRPRSTYSRPRMSPGAHDADGETGQVERFERDGRIWAPR